MRRRATFSARALGIKAMQPKAPRTICWTPTWSQNGIGFEHVLLAGNTADSSILAIDEDGEPFRLTYKLRWNDCGLLEQADLKATKDIQARSLSLQTDGSGRWRSELASHLPHLDGCIDIDIWPTPFTNSFPIWRSNLQIGQRQEFRMAWVSAPDLTVVARTQAYTRLEDRLYLFESLDGTGFKATLPIDEDGFVIDYPELFNRVNLQSRPPAAS